jgi:hypothetical protein
MMLVFGVGTNRAPLGEYAMKKNIVDIRSLHRLTSRIAAATLLAGLIVATDPLLGSSAYGGLYDSDVTAIKGGDIKDRDYWRAKWDSIRLEEALQERQPEGAVMMAVISQTNLLGELEKKYPNDEDFKKWKARAAEINGKIDPNANRGESFKPGSLWNELNYREAYVNYNYAKVAIDQQDWATAADGLREAARNLQFLQDRIKNNDRVAAWPAGASQWVTDTAADTAKLQTEVKAKRT